MSTHKSFCRSFGELLKALQEYATFQVEVLLEAIKDGSRRAQE